MVESELHTFSVPVAGNYHIDVALESGDYYAPGFPPRKPGGVIKINGSVVLSWGIGEFKSLSTPFLGTPLLTENSIKLAIIGAKNSRYRVKVYPVDLVNLSIGASVSPDSNSNGWNNTPVTVSFACDDNFAVRSCSDPVVVSSDGEKQVITGIVEDYLGNTASAEVTVNIDKTPPIINLQASSQPNASGWYNTPVTFTYHCQDNLSGLTVCEEGNTTSSDGQAK